MHRILTKQRAADIIDRFNSATVLIIGDIMVDQFIWGRVSRISPEAPVPVVRVTNESLLLGGSANVLNNVSSIGGSAAITGVIGPDEMGRWFIGQLRNRSIGTEGIIVEHDRPTIVKTRVIAHSQQVVRFDRENGTTISPESRTTMLDYIERIKDSVGTVIVSDYSKGMISREFYASVKQILTGTKALLCVDPKQNDFSLYDGCDIITPNHHEAGRAVGMEIETEEDVIQAGKSLLASRDFKAVLITRGEEGMMLFERNGDITKLPTVAKEVFDVTGAGDTVIGVLSLSLSAGATFKEAALLANRAAGIVVGKVGTATVSQNELIKAI